MDKDITLLANGSGALFRSALYQTNAAVIRTGDMALIVDPCWLPQEVERIRRYVSEHCAQLPQYLLFTHSDYDHIIGCKAFPGARIIASRALADKTCEEQEQILEQIRAFDDEYYLERDYPIDYPHVDEVVERDGQTCIVGNTELTFYLSPGHNSDGVFTVVEPLGILLAGDYLSDVEFPFIDWDSRMYEEALHKLDGILQAHPLHMIIPGHGAIIREMEEARRRKSKDLAYIQALRTLMAAGDSEGVDRLIDGCPFPRNLGKFHLSNRRQMERELQENHKDGAERD
ncbi:MAG: Zn-dependent hydrolase, glyoxylase [Paenibacillaceae bacterium]|jgi:glyoxylase-like metal-dependent hydrolase (beta-lactamase superfamily II)|nr:Zn-dependent hydrolase, glyoxylase [Paenibacillaceae bacterium]